jgi:adenylate cyclase
LSWLWLSVGVAAAIHWVAGITTGLSVRLMSSSTPFALEVRASELALVPYYRAVSYLVVFAFIFLYAWPVISYFRAGCPPPASETVRRRTVGFPAVSALASLFPWLFSTVFYPALTMLRYGRWSTELVSQQILSPLVNGFLAATASYLLVDWIFRTMVIPKMFANGRVGEVPGAATLNVRARLMVFLAAVAFIPMFTMLGLMRTAKVRWEDGLAAADVLSDLAEGGTSVFFVYAFLGVVLTLVLARTFTRPLAAVVEGLGRVQDGDLSVAVGVQSVDEVGRLQDGLNSMVAGLREKDRVMDAFGKIVDPAVRDRLLRGGIESEGELRHAAILFCDLRGFTRMAEGASPEDVVARLNTFFSITTAWVRECGGFVDKFIGDAVLAVFGLFDESEDSERRAGAAALTCALGLPARLRAGGLAGDGGVSPGFEVTMGVHCGPVLAGAIGAADRHEFTVIGDTVNVAARLQQFCKEKDAVLAVSDAAVSVSGNTGAPFAEATSEVAGLRGRSEPVPCALLQKTAGCFRD